MTMKKILAFSLMELTATIAIVLIISLVAYPVLNQYFIQTKVAEAIASAAEIQTMVTQQIAAKESVTNSGVNLDTPATISRYVAGYSIDDNGVITINTTADAGGITLTLSPSYSATSEQVAWSCAVSNAAQNSFVPSKCRI